MLSKFALAAALALASLAPAHAQQKIVIKIGYGTAGGPIHDGALELKKRLEAANKNIDVQVFPGGQLGSEGEIIGQLQAGLTDMLPTTTGPLGQHNPIFYVLETPYVFLNTAQADKVLDGPVGAKFLSALEGKGLLGLAFWENGFRELTNNVRPIKSPADLKGLKLRTQQNRLHMKYFGDLGANPTPLPFTEIYNALATKIVDGQENPYSLISTNKFYEQQKYVSQTDHVYSSVPVYFSKAKWAKLPADVQKLVRDTVYDLRLWERQRGRDQEKTYVAEISKKSEVYVLTDAEKAAFQKAAEPAFDWAKKEYGAVYESALKEVLAAAK
ncbi:DctP family TRAP transporter solute-binding subunit [Xanthobacteraceae bacterium Astr-EGSB]|uniref:DctP family TRAP transporter solute-binding subunit n=1 Tax=Astrobacterium formosum TaxID=3069710 RepID=UPI0027B5B449|nr:DctP family TRAP transporter solute-binding subunit [Xanthobacteraceae bacterium Astr-EGSB]